MDTRENIADSESDKLPLEEPDLHCVPDETRTQHHPHSAGRAYGEARGIIGSTVARTEIQGTRSKTREILNLVIG